MVLGICWHPLTKALTVTNDPDDPATLRQDLQRWRDMLKRDDIEPDARRELSELISGAEGRLAGIEARARQAKPAA